MMVNHSTSLMKTVLRLVPLALFVAIALALAAVISAGTPVLAKPMLQPPLYPIITGTVSLQGRPAPPAPPWAIPLDVMLSCSVSLIPGDYPYSVSTDQYGQFNLTHNVSGTSTCDIKVKNGHTLRNTKSGVTIVPGGNVLAFGTLREGDASNDNFVSLVDFSILATSYDKSNGDPGFDPRADFNENDRIEIADFSLLATNYDTSGDIPVAASRASSGAPAAVSMTLVSPRTVVQNGQIFSVNIRLDPRGQPFQGVAVYLKFDPSNLEVVDASGNPASAIGGGESLPVEIGNWVDNEADTIAYSAGVLGSAPPSDSFILATMRFRAKRENLDGTAVQFITQEYPPRTGVAAAGQYLPLELGDLNLRIARRLPKLPRLPEPSMP